MKNITITLDERTAAWVRLYAARRGKSISRLIGEMLHERLQEVRDYNDALRRYLAKKPFKFKWSGAEPPAREQLHDRHCLR